MTPTKRLTLMNHCNYKCEICIVTYYYHPHQFCTNFFLEQLQNPLKELWVQVCMYHSIFILKFELEMFISGRKLQINIFEPAKSDCMEV